MNKNICFIINPASGTGKWKGVEENIKKYLSPEFTPIIQYTKYHGHATILAEDAAENCSVIIGVGGDGIMNEVAAGMMSTSAILGIIPAGSGNALANHFGIPLGQKDAIECINKMHTSTVDTAIVNSRPFLAVAGTGFDAEVATMFAESKRRGFFSYIYLSVIKYLTYKPSEYELVIDGKSYTRKAFVISVANGSQYGNNAYISPEASTKDGLLDACILRPFTVFSGTVILYRLFRKTMHHSPFLEIIRGKKIEIRKAKKNEKLCLHYDGEPGGKVDEIKISIVPRSLRIITPEDHGRI
ncbi:MAG TPA: diacylglycerol kinase family protein [Bacteroidia bacterium]|jgi:diacylglycerol kinase (ATP)|nr:diacylglycerol kinase family protein [Bacteroidia bacterium]